MFKRLAFLCLIFTLVLAVSACRGRGGTDDLEEWFAGIFGEDLNLTIEITGVYDVDDTTTLIQKIAGNVMHLVMSSEAYDYEEYIIEEDGEWFSYMLYGDGEWMRFPDNHGITTMFDELFETALSSEWFEVDGNTYTLKPEHFVDVFDDNDDIGSMVITLIDNQMTMVLTGAGDQEGVVVTIVVKDVGTTVIELPDFGELDDYS